MTSDSTIDIRLDYRKPWIQAGTLRPKLDHNTSRHFDTPLRLVTSRPSFRKTRHLESPNISTIVHEMSKFQYTWPESWTAYERHYTLSLLSTCQHRNSSLAISTSWPQLWSRGQASAYNWRNTPSELCDFHSQSEGMCWYFRTALETLSTQIWGRVISLLRKREYWTFWSQNLTVDLCRIYLRPWHPGIWHDPNHIADDKRTKQLYSVLILPINYKRIMNRHARRIDPSTHVLTAS